MYVATTPAIEKRFGPIRPFECRAADSGKPDVIVGHAAVFNTWSPNWEGFRERIQPGAFKRSINSPDNIYALWGHQDLQPLASRDAGSLTVSEDETGLLTEFTPSDTSYARDLIANIRAGVVKQMSFRFMVREGGDHWAEGADGVPERTLTDVELIEVSPVTFAYYPPTDVALRSLHAWQKAQEPQDSTAFAARMFAKRARLGLITRGIPRQEIHA